jgi:hypothetical protein
MFYLCLSCAILVLCITWWIRHFSCYHVILMNILSRFTMCFNYVISMVFIWYHVFWRICIASCTLLACSLAQAFRHFNWYHVTCFKSSQLISSLCNVACIENCLAFGLALSFRMCFATLIFFLFSVGIGAFILVVSFLFLDLFY